MLTAISMWKAEHTQQCDVGKNTSNGRPLSAPEKIFPNADGADGTPKTTSATVHAAWMIPVSTFSSVFWFILSIFTLGFGLWRWWCSWRRTNTKMDDSVWKRKLDFLERVNAAGSATSKDRARKGDNSTDTYGYKPSPNGFIDKWRPIELPHLLPPLSQPSWWTHVTSPWRFFRGYHHTLRMRRERHKNTEVYLDYAAAALPIKSQLQREYEEDAFNIFANPHSSMGPAAVRTNERMQQVKKQILQLFDAGPGRWAAIAEHPPHPQNFDEEAIHPGYHIVFTSGATESLRIVAEHFRWEQESVLLYPNQAHTSVLGMRATALARGARFHCLPSNELTTFLRSCSIHKPSLLVMPLECNFGGDRFDSWLQDFERREGLYMCLDIAKAAATGPISLRRLNPDFACVSFYKLFGSPTGLGCLFIKKNATDALEWSGYFGGGSVDAILANESYQIPRSTPEHSYSSGTCHYRGIIALRHGFSALEEVGGLSAIRCHTATLARELVRRLLSLRHGNDTPVIIVYGAWATYRSVSELDTAGLNHLPGPVISFNVIRSDGRVVGYHEVAKLASLHYPPIQLRTGCMCNPGACQGSLQLTNDQIKRNYEISGHSCGDSIDLIDGSPTGVVRVSFGKDSIWEDLDVLVTFLEDVYVRRNDEKKINRKLDPNFAVLSELYLFPIKSCAAQRVKRWKMDANSGQLWMDREFALVDSSGNALRLQAYPKMAFLQPVIDADTYCMTVSAPGRKSIHISIADTEQELNNQATCTVYVCGTTNCRAILWGDVSISDWFSDFLGVPCWLARHCTTNKYRQQTRISRAIGYSDVAFANEQPILLISEESVDCINSVLHTDGQQPVNSKHFRPNLVVRSIEKHTTALRNEAPSFVKLHDEDSWKRVYLHSSSAPMSSLPLRVVGPCARCSMVDIDPTSGSRGRTLRALAEYRKRNGEITFGIFLRGSALQRNQSYSVVISEGDVLRYHC